MVDISTYVLIFFCVCVVLWLFILTILLVDSKMASFTIITTVVNITRIKCLKRTCQCHVNAKPLVLSYAAVDLVIRSIQLKTFYLHYSRVFPFRPASS